MGLDKMIVVPNEDGVKVYVPITKAAADELHAQGIVVDSQELDAASTWNEGTFYFPNTVSTESYYRLPKLSIPTSYYDQVQWAWEYFQQESLINSLVNRDVAQVVTDEEFEVPDEEEGPTAALTEWSRIVNSSIGQNGGLREYNRSLLLDIMISGLSVTLANWGPILVKGEIYTVPKVLVNLNPLALIPDIDTFTGQRKYYYKLSDSQAEAILKRRKNAITQIIPDARARLVSDIRPVINKIAMLGYTSIVWAGTGQGYYLDLPMDKAYVINYRARQQDRWPLPSLVPTFPAIAMKRKLQLADWTVADGMVNMIMVWEFPIGTDPKKAKAMVQKFSSGGRVQSHSVPAGVKISIITPDSTILNSSEKFRQPISEILAHFDIIASPTTGTDLDSEAVDKTSTTARLDGFREVLEDHNTYFLREISKRNAWDIEEIRATFQTRDLDDDENFRTFVQGAFDRGAISYETYHKALKTSTEREASRRKREKAAKLDDVFQIRPTFSQQTTGAMPTDGRPKDGSGPTAGDGPSAPRAKVN